MGHSQHRGVDRTLAGRRLRLISHSDPAAGVNPRDEGTVRWSVSAGGTAVLGVDWDNGSAIGLLEGADRWEWL
jgi:hypothetical protein